MISTKTPLPWDSLSFSQKAGYFLWPSLSGFLLSESEAKVLATYNPSGFVLFKRNFQTLIQAKNLVAALHDLAGTQPRAFPLVVAIDEEGGRVSRLPPPFPKLKSAIEICDSPEEIENQVFLQASVAKSLGINTLLAPVADVLTEVNNPVLGARCYGHSPEVVGNNVELVWNTLKKFQMFGCAKHFPGHGNTNTDSHREFATSNVSLEVLKAREWPPFARLIAANIPMIMTAHVLVPALDANYPATLSKTILQKYLRAELGFNGLILSDDLRMNAIAKIYQATREQDSDIHEACVGSTSPEHQNDDFLALASIDALLAGCDILLSCQSIVKEQIILDAIAHKLETDADFFTLCRDKAARITKYLQQN